MSRALRLSLVTAVFAIQLGAQPSSGDSSADDFEFDVTDFIATWHGPPEIVFHDNFDDGSPPTASWLLICPVDHPWDEDQLTGTMRLQFHHAAYCEGRFHLDVSSELGAGEMTVVATFRWSEPEIDFGYGLHIGDAGFEDALNLVVLRSSLLDDGALSVVLLDENVRANSEPPFVSVETVEDPESLVGDFEEIQLRLTLSQVGEMLLPHGDFRLCPGICPPATDEAPAWIDLADSEGAPPDEGALSSMAAHHAGVIAGENLGEPAPELDYQENFSGETDFPTHPEDDPFGLGGFDIAAYGNGGASAVIDSDGGKVTLSAMGAPGLEGLEVIALLTPSLSVSPEHEIRVAATFAEYESMLSGRAQVQAQVGIVVGASPTSVGVLAILAEFDLGDGPFMEIVVFEQPRLDQVDANVASATISAEDVAAIMAGATFEISLVADRLGEATASLKVGGRVTPTPSVELTYVPSLPVVDEVALSLDVLQTNFIGSDDYGANDSITVDLLAVSAPEPSRMALLASALATLLVLRQLRRNTPDN